MSAHPPKPIPVEEAWRRILAAAEPLSEERSAIADALGRTLTREVLAARTLPDRDASAMDGYAVRASDARAGVTLAVDQTLPAGGPLARPLRPGCCARIFTGAPLPPGADAVIIQERTRRLDEVRVELLEAVEAGANVRPRGEDVREGDRLVEAGTALGVPEAALLWAQGLVDIPVHRRPKVAIAATGDELRPLGAPAAAGLIDTNSPALAAACRLAGAEAVELGIAPDDPAAIRALFARGLSHDVLITSAGVSVGDRDHTRRELEALGVRLDFWRVAIKPGKPLAFGVRDRTLIFGLPGNPVSALVTFELFVRPALHRLAGWKAPRPAAARARIGEPYRKGAGLTHFVRVTCRWEGESLIAYPLPTQSSGALRSAAGATHLMQVPENVAILESGEWVDVLPIGGGRL